MQIRSATSLQCPHVPLLQTVSHEPKSKLITSHVQKPRLRNIARKVLCTASLGPKIWSTALLPSNLVHCLKYPKAKAERPPCPTRMAMRAVSIAAAARIASRATHVRATPWETILSLPTSDLCQAPTVRTADPATIVATAQIADPATTVATVKTARAATTVPASRAARA